MLKQILKVFIGCLFRVKLTSITDVSQFERTLVVANHASFLDGVVLALFLPFDATFVVHTEVKAHWLYRHLLKLVPHLAVAPNNPLAMKQVMKLVESGKPVVIFPEGRITRTGSLMKVYEGSAYIAAKTGAAVVPVRLEGFLQTYLSRVGGIYKRRLFPRLSVSVLRERYITMPAGGLSRTRRQKCAEALRQVLQASIVEARPSSTLYETFLDRVSEFGRSHLMVEDIDNLRHPGQSIKTYGTLLKMVLGLQRIVRRHTAIDENVGVLMPNTAAALALVLGLSGARRVPVPLNFSAKADGIASACVTTSLKTIFTSHAFLKEGNLADLVSGLEGIQVLYLEDLKSTFGWLDKAWVLWHLAFPRKSVVTQDSEAPAVILSTTGSESKPKGVVHSHRSILANIAQIKAVADFSPLDKFMVALPLFHSFGFTAGAMLPLLSGIPVMLYPSPLHYRVIPEVVYDRNCSVLFGTNAFLQKYAAFAHPYDFARLRYVVAGAEKLQSEVRTLWADKLGIRVLEGYGATELGPVVSVNTPMAYRKGSVGQLLPCIAHRLEPVPGIERGGLLLVSGPNLMSGYLRYELPGVLQAPQVDGEPGWYSTGDVVEIDDDGFVFIQTRLSRFAKIAGEMVSLVTAESLAQRSSEGHAHAAVAIPDTKKGEAIVLFTTDTALTRETLVRAAREQGASELAIARSIRVVDALPMIGVKTDYVKLRNLALAE